eukprot:gene10916-12131_t
MATDSQKKKKSSMKEEEKVSKKKQQQQQQQSSQSSDDSAPPAAASTTTVTTTTDSEEVAESNTTTSSTPMNSVAVTSILSDQTFSSLPISTTTKEGLQKMGFDRMTHIQARAIPECLAGSDLVAAAKTGSGKTLAFLVPIVETLQKVNFTRKQGTGALIISPTRELSLQIYGVLRELMDACGYGQTHGLVMGGANRKAEAEKLVKGVNILVATPGRLHDHLANTKGFKYDRLSLLVIDEADRILDQGFEEDMRQIIKYLQRDRQTILFSATQTRKVEDLARLAMRSSGPVYLGVHDAAETATTDGLQQGYILCPADKRFMLLYTFLKKNQKKKVMVFFSSCASVSYHAALLNYIDLPVLDIHGKQKQAKRTTTFFQFVQAEAGILLCTDVAARGLDIPAVDWIVQFDPPDDPKEYIHRVGRTGRGVSEKRGRALLFLLPSELAFLHYLRAAKVLLQEYEFPAHKVLCISQQMNALVEKNYFLQKSAQDAYRAYLLAYASHSHKDIFDVHAIDMQALAKAFGLSVPPRINHLPFSVKGGSSSSSSSTRPTASAGNGEVQVNIIDRTAAAASRGGDDGRRGKKRALEGETEGENRAKHFHRSSGHVFSADNPYGRREATDKRQFVR